MALLHELAHIRRHDNLITLLQRLAESLLFFHPVTWWLSAWVSLEASSAATGSWSSTPDGRKPTPGCSRPWPARARADPWRWRWPSAR